MAPNTNRVQDKELEKKRGSRNCEKLLTITKTLNFISVLFQLKVVGSFHKTGSYCDFLGFCKFHEPFKYRQCTYSSTAGEENKEILVLSAFYYFIILSPHSFLITGDAL